MADLSALLANIPERCSSSLHKIRCCCGRPDCAYLKHNTSALEDLEQEVKTAASLGQALLVRHEQYMLDAGRDRHELSSKIDLLEQDKRELEVVNAKTIEANRALLDQLEGVNASLVESEVHIKSLEATLHSAQQEVRRMDHLAARTLDLESQLAVLEQEQVSLQKTIISSEVHERSAIQRWKKAERGLSALQDQLERIEHEAREERESHVEVLGRMERQRAVERELDTAAERLKGAAGAAKGHTANNVVSHFVKDILQDNANLQLGIVELREMLMNSNDEVQSLREHLLQHQPVEDIPRLGAELGEREAVQLSAGAPVSQELHIHHHYHTSKEELRRTKKKRSVLNTGIFTAPRSVPCPRTSRPSENTIICGSSVTIPNHWPMQSGGQISDFSSSSVPSSPQSVFHNSSIFDRGPDLDSSRPTSSGSSVDPASPLFQSNSHRKRGSEVFTRSFITPQNFRHHNTIHEEHIDDSDVPAPHIPSQQTDLHTSPKLNTNKNIPSVKGLHPQLHRSTSHESILSVSSIDIQTLKSRPSQTKSMLLRSRISSSHLSTSTRSDITATPILTHQGRDSRAFLRDNFQVSHGRSSDPRPFDSDSACSSTESRIPSKRTEKARWVWGNWCLTPTTTATRNRNGEASVAKNSLAVAVGRPPGINQKGSIPGFSVARKQTLGPEVRIRPEVVDRDALREGLKDLD